MQPCSCYVITYLCKSFERKKKKCNKPEFAYAFLQEKHMHPNNWHILEYFMSLQDRLTGNEFWGSCRTWMRNAVTHVNATEIHHTTIWLARVEKSRSSFSISRWFRDHSATLCLPHWKNKRKDLAVSRVDCLVWGLVHGTHIRGNIWSKIQTFGWRPQNTLMLAFGKMLN